MSRGRKTDGPPQLPPHLSVYWSAERSVKDAAVCMNPSAPILLPLMPELTRSAPNCGVPASQTSMSSAVEYTR
jgi:hypothetical protein